MTFTTKNFRAYRSRQHNKRFQWGPWLLQGVKYYWTNPGHAWSIQTKPLDSPTRCAVSQTQTISIRLSCHPYLFLQFSTGFLWCFYKKISFHPYQYHLKFLFFLSLFPLFLLRTNLEDRTFGFNIPCTKIFTSKFSQCNPFFLR